MNYFNKLMFSYKALTLNIIFFFQLFLVNVYIPKDKVSGAHQGFGFVEFHAIHDADYALKVKKILF